MAAASQSFDSQGVPNFASPWLQLGRLKEREKWQSMGIILLERAVLGELQGLKNEVTIKLIPTPSLETKPSFSKRPPVQRQDSIDLKKDLRNKIESCVSNIASLFAQLKPLFGVAYTAPVNDVGKSADEVKPKDSQ